MAQQIPLIVMVAAALAPLLVVAVSLPLILGRVKPNAVYGIRTPKTFASPEIWYKANRLGGIYLTGAAILSLFMWAILAFLQPGPQWLAIYFGILGVSILAACGLTLFKLKKM